MLSRSLLVQEQHHYAYGAPLTGLSYVVGNKRYRYGYQGQYAEQDPETGWESFELRLYNARLGRWASQDPKGQFSSPYVGMGNNPASQVDPDGGLSLPWRVAFSTVTLAGVGGTVAALSGQDFWKGAAIGAAAGFFIGGGGNMVRGIEKIPLKEGVGLARGLTFQYSAVDNKQPTIGFQEVGSYLKITGNKMGTYWFQTAYSDHPHILDYQHPEKSPSPNTTYIDNGGDTKSPLYSSGKDYHDKPTHTYSTGEVYPIEYSTPTGRSIQLETSLVQKLPQGGYKILLTIQSGYTHYAGMQDVLLHTLEIHKATRQHKKMLRDFAK